MIILDLGLTPAAPLSLNQERTMHWAQRNRRLDPWKITTFWMAKEAKLPAAVAGCSAIITAVLPVRGHYRRDPANYYPTVKAIVDGLVLAGVWSDDTPEYVTVNEPILVDAKVQANAEVRIELLTPAPGPNT